MAHVGSLHDAFEDFIADKEYQGVSPATIHFYRRNWAHFLSDTGVDTLAGLSAASVRGWLLNHRHLSPTTLATYDRSLRVTMNWLEKRGYLADNPMRTLPKRRTPRALIDTFSRGDVQAILAQSKEGRHPQREPRSSRCCSTPAFASGRPFP